MVRQRGSIGLSRLWQRGRIWSWWQLMWAIRGGFLQSARGVSVSCAFLLCSCVLILERSFFGFILFRFYWALSLKIS